MAITKSKTWSDDEVLNATDLNQGYDEIIDAINGLLDSESLTAIVKASIIGAIYPIGSIYTSTLATNPGTTLGVGTWEAFGTGRVMVGFDSGQTEFNTVLKTGGAKTHTLTTNEMPAHKHFLRGRLAATSGGYQETAGYGNSASGYTLNGIPIENNGGGAAHNNLQPYIVVYSWKRIV
jgi:microcystin-dependent protein